MILIKPQSREICVTVCMCSPALPLINYKWVVEPLFLLITLTFLLH